MDCAEYASMQDGLPNDNDNRLDSIVKVRLWLLHFCSCLSIQNHACNLPASDRNKLLSPMA